ncbi:MAG: ROK family protein [Aurantimicrobium sp.]
MQPDYPVIAFDVGGTDIKSTFVDAEGNIRQIRRTPTPRSNNAVNDILDTLSGIHADYVAELEIPAISVGLAVPGLVDEKSGIAHYSANIGWQDTPLRAWAQDRLGMPVALCHDVRSAAVAESRFGAGIDSEHMLAVVIGTGIASTLVIQGSAYLGSGTAGEIGHGVFDPAGPPCGCGSRGCLENIVSARAMLTAYEMATGELLDGAKDLISRAASGDKDAKSIWAESVRSLAVALTRICTVIAPDTVVIGGGISRAGDALFLPLREHFESFMGRFPKPLIVPATLGDDAGLIGSLYTAQQLAKQLHS